MADAILMQNGGNLKLNQGFKSEYIVADGYSISKNDLVNFLQNKVISVNKEYALTDMIELYSSTTYTNSLERIIKLDDYRVLISHVKNGSTADYIGVCIVKFSSDYFTYTKGTDYNINISGELAFTHYNIDVYNNKILATWAKNGTSYEYQQVIAGTINDTTISFGSVVSPNGTSGDSFYGYAVWLTENIGVLYYHIGSGVATGGMYCKILTIDSSNVITYLTNHSINLGTAGGGVPKCVRLSDTTFLQVTPQYETYNYISVITIDAINDTATTGNIVSICSTIDYTHAPEIVKINDSKFIIAPPITGSLVCYFANISGTNVSINATSYNLGSCGYSYNSSLYLYDDILFFSLLSSDIIYIYRASINIDDSISNIILECTLNDSYSKFVPINLRVLNEKIESSFCIADSIIVSSNNIMTAKVYVADTTANGIALSSGSSGNTIKVYDWRYL